MASNARKELAKALRVTFGADHGSNSPPPPSLEDYEPPEALLESIDEWANSSAIQSSTTERDISKLRETLLEHCFEQGTISEHATSTEKATQARSAFIVVLDRFSSLDSGVVTVKEIREIWWNRLLLPALTLPDSASDTIRLGRSALKAAKDMTVRALNVTVSSNTASAEAEDSTELERTKAIKWMLSVFRACLRAPNESFAQRNLQSVLVAFGKAHPKDFFFTISELLDKPVEALSLLNNFIRLHPIQAYQALQTPLFSKIVAMLDSLPVSFLEGSHPSSEQVADKLVETSAALCTLNMLMPRLPTSLDKLLDRLFIILARCLLWYDAVGQIAHPVNDEFTDDEEDEDTRQKISKSQAIKSAPTLAPLLDYFTQLYGLFPANLIAFLSTPTRWLQSFYRRMRKRRHRVPSSANLSALGRDALLGPIAAAGGLTTYSSSSTSADEDASATDLPISGAEEGDLAAQIRRKRANTKSGGRKGQRSKTSKARRDTASKARKEKEAAKQKERERRRRATNFLQNAPAGSTSAAEQSDVPFLSTTGRERANSTSSVGSSPALPSAVTTEGRTSKVRIAEPEKPSSVGHGAGGSLEQNLSTEGETHSTDSEDNVSVGSDVSIREIEEDLEALDLEGALAAFDWARVRELSAPYLSQHVVVPGLTETTEAEFIRNKIRFKKLEASDLVDEITRTRIHQSLTSQTTSYDSALANSMTSPPPSSLSASTNMLGFSLESLPENKQIMMMQSQLIFEMYQKNQLVQRLGSLLRERIATSGAEADKQNLMHQIRSLKGQLTHSQEKLEQLRHESALSRERLNKYSSDQSNRVEKLRGEKQALNTENTSLKAELADLKASIVAMNEELAESRKECFELKSERDWEMQLKEQKRIEEEEKLKKEATAKEAETKEAKFAELEPSQEIEQAENTEHESKNEESEVEVEVKAETAGA